MARGTNPASDVGSPHPIMKKTRREFLSTATALASAFPAFSTAAVSPVAGVALAPPDEQPENLKVEEAPARTLGWAIVGLGELALEEIMPAFASCRLSKPVALVSGHPDKAAKIAKAHDIAPDAIYNYDNFDNIAGDKRIDVVYIVLPNSMHAEFTIRALKAGKHVLCEKPMAVSVAEGESMRDAATATRLKLSIAYRLHHEPLNRQVMEWCKERKFGKIRSINSSNCQNVKAPNIRLSSKLGGGPVGDVGVYSINAARYITGEEPYEVMATAFQPDDDPRFREVPETVAFLLRYPSGIIATCDCSFGTTESRRYRVLCERGFLEMDPAFSYRGLKLRTKEDLAEESSGLEEVNLRQVDHFAAEMDAFSKAVIEDGEVITPASMGIADLKIIAAIHESVKTGAVVKIS
ncbi:MAG: Gfo/Idh/MocA family oxidoreductase [Verrucomicrobiaceae bacterium]|nr:MAG: Gfo/Idh/MocA family oxidoreductase [Verrucomicrobiaceae bacterium]